MAGENYKHIFLKGPNRKEPFTSPQGGGSIFKIKERDRLSHSKFLNRRFNEAWEEAGQRKAALFKDRKGAYIEFISEPGYELWIQSLELRRSGIRLLNVREIDKQDRKKTCATIYVPYEKRSQFLRKINAYAEKDTKMGKPRYAKLIQNISDIRAAILESFWQDDIALLPCESIDQVEVWLRSDGKIITDEFDSLLNNLKIKYSEGRLTFPERNVKVIAANKLQLEELIENSDEIAELRLAKELASYFIKLENKEQTEIVNEFLKRIIFEDDFNISICILDSGINNRHSLIRSVLSDSDLHVIRSEWDNNDDSGHGTLMAGIATYGDLLSVLSSKGYVRIIHRLESSKILPPLPAQNPKELWGFFTSQGISLAEIQAPQRKRIICMAISAVDFRDRGRPSSWSAAIDQLSSGYEDDMKRLIIISAGNIEDSYSWNNYPNDNLTNEIHDPGQAWNALTVGAFTQKIQIIDPTLNNYVPIAPKAGLSPYSTTSCAWETNKWPIKPDVLFEGGNVARGPNNSIFDPEDLQLFSTYYKPLEAQFAAFGRTSAATAQASWMAAQIQALYPHIWPETIRALIVHSANWTNTMKEQFLKDNSKKSYAKLLRICGYGVPNLEHALYSAANSLTLISEATLQPYDKKDNYYIIREMHLYNLPWPKEILQELGEVPVEMRITLSYFIEPGPGEIGWTSRYRYASHGLRFDVNGPTESPNEFIKRINKQAREDKEKPETEGATDKWLIGKARNLGSIHSDIWKGSAAELAASNNIAIYPIGGWWKERYYLNRWNRQCRYSLICTIRTPEQDIDIYTPVAQQVGIAIPIDIKLIDKKK